MTTKVPQSVRSTRAQTLNGVTYSANQVLTSAQVLALPHLAALLSSGRLETVPDMHDRRSSHQHKPSYIAPSVMAAMTTDYDLGTGGEQNIQTVAAVDGHQVTVTITGGQFPYMIDWDDASDPESFDGQVAVHVYASEATFTIATADDSGNTDTVDATVAAMTVVATPTGLVGDIVVANARAPISVNWGDGSDPDALLTHTYDAGGTYSIVVTDADGVTATDDVTVA